MLRSLIDRLQFALIGLFFGSVLGAAGWYLVVGRGSSLHRLYPALDALANTDIGSWIKYVGGAFAVVGFIFKEYVGDALGETTAVIYRAESRHFLFPFTGSGIVLLALVAVIVLVWKSSH
jgi:hypothetical protein